MKGKDITYEEFIVLAFSYLTKCFGVDKAIILLYELNKLRGVKI